MNQVAVFSKVSEIIFADSYRKCFPDASASEARDALKIVSIPCRATKGSAGYDFFLPCDIKLNAGESFTVPTGIRVRIDDGWVLMVFPRSGLGFRYRLQLDNTVGVIDSDYYDSDNEGHIMIRITNDSKEPKTLQLRAGDRFAQGIFLPYGITYDDQTEKERNGGFGSTGES